MRISVVMAIYNGEKYLYEQLVSIRLQSVAADEVIIVDDCSTDDSPSIIRSFIDKYQLNHWQYHLNEKNMGWKLNFIHGIGMASGDLIFLSDQDDIWHKDKIETMSRIMEGNSDILLLASNYQQFFMDGSVNIRKKETAKFVNDDKCWRYPYYHKFMYVVRPGCVYCVRKDLIGYAKKYWFAECPHDAFFWRIACLKNGLYIYNRKTIDFRRHDSNASDLFKKTKEVRIKNLNNYLTSINILKEIAYEENIRSRIKSLNRIEKFCQLRLHMNREKNVMEWIRLLFYMDCYYSFRSWLADLYLMFMG